MTLLIDQFGHWLLDYYLAASLLIIGALSIMFAVRQPVRRSAVARATLVGLALLIVLTMLPGWPRTSVLDYTTLNAPPITEVAEIRTASAANNSSFEELAAQVAPATAGSAPDAPPSADSTIVASGPLAQNPMVTAEPWILPEWPALIGYTFAVGFALITVWLARGLLELFRIGRRAKPAPADVVGVLSGMAREQDATPRLLVSRQVNTAVAWGIWRPTIVVSPSLCRRAHRQQLRAALAHEPAHIQKRDLWTLHLSSALLLLLFAQPAFWLLRRLLDQDRELLADMSAVQVTSRAIYAETLLSWVKAVHAGPQTRSAAVLGVFERSSHVSQRIETVLDNDRNIELILSTRWRSVATVTTIFMAVALSLFSVGPTVADDADAKHQPADPAAADQPDSTETHIADPGNGEFRHKFSSGAVVELVGVCEHPSQGRRWWKGDGTALGQPPYEKFNSRVRGPGKTVREFCLRSRDLPDGDSLIWRVSQGGSSARTTPRTADGEKVLGLDVKAVAMPADAKTCTIRIGVPTGEWVTRHEFDGRGSGSIENNHGTVAYSPAIERNGTVNIVVSHNLKDDIVRLVAVDIKGNVQRPSRSSASGGGGFMQLNATFKRIALPEIVEFQLQGRPREWAELKNVRLHPTNQAGKVGSTNSLGEELNRKLAKPLDKREAIVSDTAEQQAAYAVATVDHSNGMVIDPDGDCNFEAQDGKVVITIPGIAHDLSSYNKKKNAPRILREVEGDFIVEVKVSCDLDPGDESAEEGKAIFNGAGLLIWHDDDHFVRFERNAFLMGTDHFNGDEELARRQETRFQTPLFEYWRQGTCSTPQSSTTEPFFKGKSTWLRIERRGDKITASLSHDGEKWDDTRDCPVTLPNKLLVGVAAINTSKKPFQATFEEFKLTKIKTATIPVESVGRNAADPVTATSLSTRRAPRSASTPVPAVEP